MLEAKQLQYTTLELKWSNGAKKYTPTDWLHDLEGAAYSENMLWQMSERT